MSQRGLIVSLLISLALNFFLLGAGATVVVIGARLAKLRAVAATSQGPLQPIRRAALALPPGPRGDFAQAVKAVNTAEHANALAARQLRLEAWTALGSDQVDPAAIKAKLDKARLIESGVRAKVEGAVVDFSAKLPQAQRAAVGQEMRPQPPLQQQPPPAASASSATP